MAVAIVEEVTAGTVGLLDRRACIGKTDDRQDVAEVVMSARVLVSTVDQLLSLM
jgi:hypothetical protein